MEEEWIKVIEILRVENLIKGKYLIDFAQKEWEEILKPYEIKYKLDIEQGSEYIGNVVRQYNLKKVYMLNLYTTKENIDQMKSIIKDVENAQLETPPELQEIDEEDNNEEVLPEKVSKYFFTILMILLIIFEIGMMIYFFKEKNTIPSYVVMGIVIVGELYCIKIINSKKKRNKNEQ